ncbi:substrate-binding domain-containing protein [bacterium]|nr:substrate-binding domain-containing protein [bacterium]
MQRRIGFSTLGVLSLAFLLSGCGGGTENAVNPGTASSGAAPAAAAKPGGLRFIFVTNSNADWWNAMEKGMQDAAAEFGVKAEMRRNEQQSQGQIRLLEDALSLDDVSGVAVSVFEAESPGIADALKRLKDAGKVVITVDSDIAPNAVDARSAYIGTFNVKAGEAAGKAAAALRPDGGKTAVFVGTAAAANARERREGFFAGAGSKFSQVEIFEDQTDKNKAQVNVQTALSKYPDLGVLVGLWSYNAPRIAEEVSRTPDIRKKVNVVTFDLDELAVGHLQNRNIDATVCQNPYDMGFQGVKLLKALVEKNDKAIAEVLPDGKVRDTGVRIVVPDKSSPVKGDNVMTIEEMKAWLSSKGLKST